MVEFPADRSQVTFGSAASCSHRIRHHSIAEMHAALVRTPNRGVYLVDLTGGNGTFVNEEPVVDRVLLMDRDRIRLGSGVEYEYVDGTLPRESRVRQWVRRMTFTASKTGW
jgi:pSer/pThr/pTyr-binding forkhead associated (FHA) protein